MSKKTRAEVDKLTCKIADSKKRKLDGIPDEFLRIASNTNNRLDELLFSQCLSVYNPTQYARNTFELYVRKYCSESKKIMFLGMNPGPWGMSQTGVPFGEVDAVKNWLKIEGAVGKPQKELPSRPVEGFSCVKSEVSGKRFWGLMKELCVKPQTFFKHSFVYNYLPLQFINASGRNIPPTLLKKGEQEALYKICDEALVSVVQLYHTSVVIGVGKFAESRAKLALQELDKSVRVFSILHPSPRSKAANNWTVDVLKQLEDLGLLQYLT